MWKRNGNRFHILKVLRSEHEDVCTSVCVSSDGSRAFAGMYQRKVTMWDVASGAIVRHTTEGPNNHLTESLVNCVPVSCETRLFSGTDDFDIQVWDVETGACVHTLHNHYFQRSVFEVGKSVKSSAEPLAFCMANSKLYVGSAQKRIHVWSSPLLEKWESLKSDISSYMRSGVVLSVSPLPAHAQLALRVQKMTYFTKSLLNLKAEADKYNVKLLDYNKLSKYCGSRARSSRSDAMRRWRNKRKKNKKCSTSGGERKKKEACLSKEIPKK